MARVIILTHSSFTHLRSGTVFQPRPILLNEGDAGKQILGIADDVPAEVAEEFFASHDSFRVEWSEEEQKARDEAAEAAEKAAEEARKAAEKAAKASK